MEYLSSQQIKKEIQRILDYVVKILDENNLKYSLCAGTLIGAIRHKGFIPWDDDIDIMLPREDYDKLMNIFRNSVLEMEFKASSYELGNSSYPFCKVCNTEYLVKYDDKIKEEYLWIDIFPADNFPIDDKEATKWCEKGFIYRRLYEIKNQKNESILNEKKGIMQKMAKLLLKFFMIFINERILTGKIVKLSHKYEDIKTPYTGIFVWGYGSQDRTNKKNFDNLIEVEFEGKKYKAFADYNQYLTTIYGDYMKLPPEEKRNTHKFKAYKVSKNDGE